jgi:hypothetical protein
MRCHFGAVWGLVKQPTQIGGALFAATKLVESSELSVIERNFNSVISLHKSVLTSSFKLARAVG